jgi:feruloyl esterase
MHRSPIRFRRGRTCLLLGLLAGGPALSHLGAQASQFERWQDRTPPKAPRLSCAALRALTSYEFSIDTATLVAATDTTPEFCRVLGLVAPEIRFEVALPTAWNGRLYMFGNGGYAGESLAAGFRAGRRSSAVARGFVVAQTNTGHDAAREPLAAFASSPQKVVDYAYRAVHVTAVTAKRVARAYYESAPARAYFDGCSTGGRQGLVSAQRFPEDFDGIVVGAPVLDFTGVMTHYSVAHRALAEASLSEPKIRLVADTILGACDKVDGLEDGLIDDPRRCKFNPATDLPRCAAGGTQACVTDRDVAALAAIYGPVAAGATRVFPGFPVGIEAIAPTPTGPRTALDPWFIRAGRPSISWEFAEAFFTNLATPGTPLDLRTFDAEKDRAKLEPIGAILNATDTDLSAFKARGGRILMYFGWADPALSPLMGTEYYEKVREKMGPATTDFFRLFMMPGVFHCAGGVGPDSLDTITPLADWVERGIAPDRLVAARRAGGSVVRTRPLCPYPQVARHNGTGSIDDAANFTCSPPQSPPPEPRSPSTPKP